MRIKRFVGRTLKDATEQMRKDLGPDAVVLNSRNIPRQGQLSFLAKEMFEVTAAVDDVTPPRRNPYARRAAAARAEEEDGAGDAGGAEDPVESLRKVAQRFQQRAAGGSNEPGKHGGEEFAQLKLELSEMRGTLSTVVEHLKYDRMPALPEHLRALYMTLVNQDVEARLAADLVQSVYATAAAEEKPLGAKAAERAVLEAMAGLVPPAPETRTRRRRTHVAALVGPTGVGKTTTVAKLAAINKLIHHRSVGLVSADTYRIGAIEQLRTFAAIADIPMEVAYKPAELAAAIRKFRDRDIVLIDTVGRSQRSPRELTDLARFIEAADPDDIHLVLSAATSTKNALDIIEKFRVLKPNRLLFSKLDEAVTLGGLLSVASRDRLPVSFVTTGQTVPDDIVRVDPAKFAHMVYSGDIAHA
ncbi:MAG TPA: flagellar biosynthesis protein FlhF [Bacteroidota bacterium]|nr:flagellar biosynthesis protein FlhF [Bacteroidota bacterium]